MSCHCETHVVLCISYPLLCNKLPLNLAVLNNKCILSPRNPGIALLNGSGSQSLMRLQLSYWPRMQLSEGLTGAEGITSKLICVVFGRPQFLVGRWPETSVPHYWACHKLPECPHDMIAASSRLRGKRERKRENSLDWSHSLWSDILFLPFAIGHIAQSWYNWGPSWSLAITPCTFEQDS